MCCHRAYERQKRCIHVHSFSKKNGKQVKCQKFDLENAGQGQDGLTGIRRVCFHFVARNRHCKATLQPPANLEL